MSASMAGLLAVGLVLGGLAADDPERATATAAASTGQPGERLTQTVASEPDVAGRGRAADPVSPQRGARRTADPRPEQVGLQETVDAAVGYTGKRVQRFHFPGADYVKVRFSRLAVLPGDEVTVSDPDGVEVHSYRADPRVLKVPGDSPTTRDESGGIWAMSVAGDTAVVTLRSRAESLTERGGELAGRAGDVVGDLSSYGVEIDRVARGFTPGEGSRGDDQPAGPGSEESVCGRDDKKDAVCYKSDHPAEFDNSHPVARLLIDGRSLCTAWRIGPNNRLLTNNHCIDRTFQARDTEVWFNYQCTACGDRRVKRPTKVVGADVLATERRLDYTLFTVRDFDAIRDFGHLTLDNRKAQRGEEVYIPQHPGGSPKKIAMESDRDSRGACRIDSPAYDGNFSGSDASYYCDTEAGSSGSPVLSRRTHKVIALHHFGGCPNSGVRSDLLHEQIADQL